MIGFVFDQLRSGCLVRLRAHNFGKVPQEILIQLGTRLTVQNKVKTTISILGKLTFGLKVNGRRKIVKTKNSVVNKRTITSVVIEDILALIVNQIITDDLKQNPRVNVESWAYLMNIKADFLIGFNQIVNLSYCFQKQSRKTILGKALQIFFNWAQIDD